MRDRKFAVGVECRKMLTAAVDKKLPVTLTCKEAGQSIAQEQEGGSGGSSVEHWRVYKANLLALNQNRIVLSQPLPQANEAPLEAAPGTEIAVTFKKGYNKCLFITRIIGPQQVVLDAEADLPYTVSSLSGATEDEEGLVVPGIAVYRPEQIEKIRRRAYNRTETPIDWTVPVTFWHSSKPQQKYSAVLANISAGGIGVALSEEDVPELEENGQYEIEFDSLPSGDEIGQPASLPTMEAIHAPVRFRHKTTTPEGSVLLGFQLIGLEVTEEGRQLLRRISRIVGVYERRQPFSRHRNLQR